MRKFSLFLLLCGLVLCLAACGPKETTPDDDDIVGDDWRTWGTIQDTGTLTRGGDSTDVCICVSDDGAKLYYDLPEQELYGSVVFPESIDGAAGCYQDTDFTDLDGDGNSDMQMTFHVDGQCQTYVWYWNAVNGQFMDTLAE